MSFSEEDVNAYPSPNAVLEIACQWLESGEVKPVPGEAWYTPEPTGESGVESVGRRWKQRAKAKASQPGASTTERPKRVTTASLAAAVQDVVATLPTITEQMRVMLEKQKAMEERMNQQSSVSAALSQPLGGRQEAPVRERSLVAGLASPPRMRSHALLQTPVPKPPPQVLELEKERQELGCGSDLAQAMLAQSAALTSLVAQITSNHQGPASRLATWSPSRSSRSPRTGSAATGVGIAEGALLSFGSVVDGEEDGTYISGRPAIWCPACKRDIRREILREVWRIWSSKGSWYLDVPGDDGHRLSDGRECGGGKGHGGFDGRDAGTSLPRRRTVRVSPVPDPAGGHSSLDIHIEANFSAEPFPSICSTSRSTMDNGGTRISEGDGCHRVKERRANIDIGSFSRWRRSFNPRRRTRKGRSKEEEEQEGGRRRGGCLDSFPSTALGFLESTCEFNGWASALPR